VKTKALADDDGATVRTDKKIGSAEKKAQDEIKALKAELEKQQQKKRHASPEPIPSACRAACPAKV
jgi:hypothetical protein